MDINERVDALVDDLAKNITANNLERFENREELIHFLFDWVLDEGTFREVIRANVSTAAQRGIERHPHLLKEV